MRKTWLVCGHQGDVPAGADPEMLMCARCQAKPFIPWHVSHMLEMPHALREAEPEDRDYAAIAASGEAAASVLWRHMVRYQMEAVRYGLAEYIKKCQEARLSGLDLAKLVEKKIEFDCLDPNITDPFRFVLGLEFVAPYLPDDKHAGIQLDSPEYEKTADENEESSSDRDPIAAERSAALEAYKRESLDRDIKIGDKHVPKESREAKKPVRRNQKYKVIDEALQAIAESRPRTQEEVFQCLDRRHVVTPPAEPFMAASGWIAGFYRDAAAARAWLSKRWAELNLSGLPRGPKNPKK